jgi:hypothetical protein
MSYIVYCTIHMHYMLYYTISKYCTISTYYTLQCEVNYMSQHSTSILSIRLSLDNDYGTIIS